MRYDPVPSGVTPAQPPRLLDSVRAQIRLRHYSIRTEQAYLGWIRRFILANGKRHPREMGGDEVAAFLSRLATEGKVAPATQNQALDMVSMSELLCQPATARFSTKHSEFWYA